MAGSQKRMAHADLFHDSHHLKPARDGTTYAYGGSFSSGHAVCHDYLPLGTSMGINTHASV